MLTGALWAGIAALLKVTRGVSEVVATIMLNAIATSSSVTSPSDNIWGAAAATTTRPADQKSPAGCPASTSADVGEIYGLVFLAVLSASSTGWSSTAPLRLRPARHRRSDGRGRRGVDVEADGVIAMLISGAVAGLSGLPLLLGDAHTYSLSFPTGLGFTGITIALLGRNNPVGIAFAALLFAFLDKSRARLRHRWRTRRRSSRSCRADRLPSSSPTRPYGSGVWPPSRSGSRAELRGRAAAADHRRRCRRLSTATVAKPQAQQPGKGGRRSRSLVLLRSRGVLVLTSPSALITGADGITSTGTVQARRRCGADRPRRPRRPVVRARGRRQHRPRRHDDPRHLVRRLGRLPVGPVDGVASASSAACSAASCTPSPR